MLSHGVTAAFGGLHDAQLSLAAIGQHVRASGTDVAECPHGPCDRVRVDIDALAPKGR